MERDRMRASNEWAASFSIFRLHHQHRISHHNIPHMTIPASTPTATHSSNLIVNLIIRVRIPGVQFQFQHQSIFAFPCFKVHHLSIRLSVHDVSITSHRLSERPFSSSFQSHCFFVLYAWCWGVHFKVCLSCKVKLHGICFPAINGRKERINLLFLRGVIFFGREGEEMVGGRVGG
jgi:hypothetical protein